MTQRALASELLVALGALWLTTCAPSSASRAGARGAAPSPSVAVPTSEAAAEVTSLSPIEGADGGPSTVLRVSPVLSATLLVGEGPGRRRIGRIDGDLIVWDALPTTGLPDAVFWSGFVGRYPDLLWLMTPSDRGGEIAHRWHPARAEWIVDPGLERSRRGALFLLPWRDGGLLAASAEPESILGEPPRSRLWTIPAGDVPALPALPRHDLADAAVTAAGDLVLAFGAPAEIILLGSGGVWRHPVPGGAGEWIRRLAALSATEVHLVCDDGRSERALTFDGVRWSPMTLPDGDGALGELVVARGPTLWMLDGSGRLWKRPPREAWVELPLPPGCPPAVALLAAADQERVWVVLEPDSESGQWRYLTIGRVRERP